MSYCLHMWPYFYSRLAVHSCRLINLTMDLMFKIIHSCGFTLNYSSQENSSIFHSFLDCGVTVCLVWQCVLVVRLIMHVLSFFAPCMAPPAARSRTLQWDTDPSVLQLQADSELGYFLPPLSFCRSCSLIIFSLYSPFHSLCVSFNAQYSDSQSFPVWPFIYLPLSVPYLALPLSISFFLSLLGLNAFSWLLSSCLPGAVYDIDWFTLTSTGAHSFFFVFINYSC